MNMVYLYMYWHQKGIHVTKKKGNKGNTSKGNTYRWNEYGWNEYKWNEYRWNEYRRSKLNTANSAAMEGSSKQLTIANF